MTLSSGSMIRGGLFGAFALAAASWAAPAGAVVIDSQIFKLSLTTTSVDRVRFDVLAGGTVNFDLLSWEQDPSTGNWVDLNGDGEAAFFDTYIRLFDDDGNLDAGDQIAINDDSGILGADGSLYGLDSNLTVVLGPGSYILAVGAFFLSQADAVIGINSDGAGGGNYPFTCNPASLPFCSTVADHDHGDYRITVTGDAVLANVRADAQIAVPEPGALALLGLGLAGLGFARRRRAG